MREKIIIKMDYRQHSNKLPINDMPTVYHTDDTIRVAEAYITSEGKVERDGKQILFQDLRIYYGAKSK